MSWVSDVLLIVVLLLVVVQSYFLVRFAGFATRVEQLLGEIARR